MLRNLLLGFGMLMMGFLFGYFVGVTKDIPRVHLDVQNSSKQEISSMIIRETNNNFIAENLGPGEKRRLGLPIPLESSFKVEVTFKDGRRLVDGEHYTEPGYRFLVTVTDKEIKTDVNLAGRYTRPSNP